MSTVALTKPSFWLTNEMAVFFATPKMYSGYKFVSHYYVYIQHKTLELNYLKLQSYLPKGNKIHD